VPRVSKQDVVFASIPGAGLSGAGLSGAGAGGDLSDLSYVRTFNVYSNRETW
jgi:hypothetical protein